jgi:hypothetical protein
VSYDDALSEPTMRLILSAVLALTGCSVQTVPLRCISADVRYTLTLPNGTERTADLGCRAALQTNTPRRSQRRLLLRLDTGGITSGAAGGDDTAVDTGPAPVDDWSGTEGVVIGLAWSKWDKRLNHQLEIEPWTWRVPDDDAALERSLLAFGAAAERPETAVAAAFFTPDGATEPREFKSQFEGGWVQATGYAYQTDAGQPAVLQLIIQDLELDDGAVLDLEADLTFESEAPLKVE